ncbi:MAG: hypothetical protein AB1773_11710 [Pseudomonadota bacterium]
MKFRTLAAAPAIAQDIELTPTLAFAAYETGSSGFNMAAATGKSIEDRHGTDVCVPAAGDGVACLARSGSLEAGNEPYHCQRSGARRCWPRSSNRSASSTSSRKVRLKHDIGG